MSEGMLYVAPVGVPSQHTVHNGQFEHDIGNDWHSVSFLSAAEITYDANINMATELTVTSTAFNVSAIRMMTGQEFQLIWENTAKDTRVWFPRTHLGWGGITVTKARARSMFTCKFTLTEQPGTYATGSGKGPGLSIRMVPGGGAWTAMGTTTTGFAAGGVVVSSGIVFTSSAPGSVTWPASSPNPATGRGSVDDLVPGRLTGYREWVALPADLDDGPRPARLASITANTVWPWTPINTAFCHRAEIAERYSQFRNGPIHDPGEAPHPDCSCGIYAKFNPITQTTAGTVAGIIEGWGPTEFGTDAFRSRHARLVGLYDVPTFTTERIVAASTGATWQTRRLPPRHSLLEELGKTYNVPVYENITEATAKHPPSNVRELLGETEPQKNYPCPRCGLRGLYYGLLSGQAIYLCFPCDYRYEVS